MNYSLRQAIGSDLSFIRHAHEVCMRPHIERQFGFWDTDFQAAKFSGSTAVADHQILELDSVPIGCCLVRELQNEIYLDRIWVLPGYQSQGIGTAFMRDLIYRAETLGVPIRLRVLRSNPAHSLYRRLDFTVTGETQTHYEMQRKPSPKRGPERTIQN